MNEPSTVVTISPSIGSAAGITQRKARETEAKARVVAVSAYPVMMKFRAVIVTCAPLYRSASVSDGTGYFFKNIFPESTSLIVTSPSRAADSGR